MIAFRVQKRSEIIIEKSNFYFCLFVNESIGSDNKSRIQGNSFCAKKYIFEEKLMNEKEYLERVDARIFSLEIEKTVGETFKINRIELQNFRRYEGNLKIDLTGKNKKPSAFTLIYAPNGYGKTSLFDGLEYAFKGEVERIVDLIKSNKDQPLKGAIYHNKNCADKPAYSQIELEDGRIIKRNVASIKDGKNDSRLNQLGKNSGLNIIGSTMDKEKWNRIILPHDKIDTFISAYTPTERYKEWMKSAPELEAERENFIESYKALRDKEISLEKIEKEIKELKKELTKIEKSKVAVIQLGKLCEEYNALAKSEDSLFFNETKSSLEIYNNLLNKIAKRIRYIKGEVLTSYDLKLEQGKNIRNGKIRDAESLEFELKNVEDKKQKFIEQKDKYRKFVNIEKDIKTIEEKFDQLKKKKDPLDTIYELGIERVEDEKNRYLELNKEIAGIEKTEKYFELENKKSEKAFNDLIKKTTEIQKIIDSKEMLISIEEKIETISKEKKNILIKKQDIRRIKEAINKFDELIKLKKKESERIDTIKIPRNISELSIIKWAEVESFLSNEEQMQLKTYENCWRELKKELEVREEIQNQENKIAEETKKICELGSEFLLNHREQTSCPLCKEPFANWEELFERVNRVGKTTEKENREKRQLIINHINELDIEYEKFYNMFFSKKENEQVKRLDQLIIYEREKNNKEIQLGNLEIEIDSLELLYEMREENGARTYFEKYTAICKKIENQNKNLENKVLQIRKVKKSYEIEKNTLEMKLKDYFSQTIMNEIYQKIDPHEIMKNVTYHLNFNEKDEPQLFIEVCEGEESSKEVYRPETYFSTAQLNTVAFSSFFGRALSTNNLPVKTICIDDPIGHFDDMNILGFTDMVRCILEKQDCQIIMSTHEEKVYQIMKRKLDPNFYNTLFIQLDNSEKVIWNRANC